jgi:hypothetical protein
MSSVHEKPHEANCATVGIPGDTRWLVGVARGLEHVSVNSTGEEAK